MNYRVDVFDRNELCVGRFGEVPLLEVVREGPDGRDRIEGLLPTTVERFGVGYTVRVSLDGVDVATATVTEARAAWGDVRRLIVDRYVKFQELVAFSATADRAASNGHVAVRFENQRVDSMVRETINRARGPVHYTVSHTAYPDGAGREYAKFAARKAVTDALPVGGIDTGQWVDASRIDLSGAWAKDGDTIAGLAVDGEPWPDLRLMMIDCEETSLNSHAIRWHPEIADWDSARYDRSVYKRKADAATARLQDYMDTKGIDFIELNPHQDSSGAYDDRVDLYGRYLGLVYGGGECFNAGLVEEGLAEVYLYSEGRYLDPSLALKEFYSYLGVHDDSVDDCAQVVGALDMRGGALEVVAALGALANGYVFRVSGAGAVEFRRGDRIDEVVAMEPVEVGVELGRQRDGLVNLLRIVGNPEDGVVDAYHADDDSIDLLGTAFRFLPFYGLSRADDAARLGAGLLRDLAWPSRVGRAHFYRGVAHIGVGSLLEFRGDVLLERDGPLAAAWQDDFGERFVGRVRRVVHRLAGAEVSSQLDLTSPYRSVASPLTFITRSQDSLAAFFQFRLDDEAIGLDIGYHLN